MEESDKKSNPSVPIKRRGLWVAGLLGCVVCVMIVLGLLWQQRQLFHLHQQQAMQQQQWVAYQQQQQSVQQVDAVFVALGRVELLLTEATIQLQYAGQKKAALALLQQAITIVEDSDISALQPLITALHADYQAVQQAADVDLLWLHDQLQAVAAGLQALPNDLADTSSSYDNMEGENFPSTFSILSAGDASSKESSSTQGFWQRQWLRMVDKVRGWVHISRYDRVQQPIDRHMAQQWQIMQADWYIQAAFIAAVSRDQAVYDVLLQSAKAWVQRAYPAIQSTTAAQVIEQLAALQSYQLRPKLPDVQHSQQVLAELWHRQEQEEI